MHFSELKQKLFYDKAGKLVIGQMPNPPILLWGIFKLLAFLEAPSSLTDEFSQVSTLFLFVWAYLEITQGTNYFRRLLGLVVGLFILINL